MPKWLWRCAGISVLAKKLLILLDDHRNKQTGQCNPRRKMQAKELADSVEAIKRALTELRTPGLIHTTKRQRGNSYRIEPRSQRREILSGQNRPADGPASLLSELDPLNSRRLSPPRAAARRSRVWRPQEPTRCKLCSDTSGRLIERGSYNGAARCDCRKLRLLKGA